MNKSTDKVLLRNDAQKYERMNALCIHFCRHVNDIVMPALRKLDLLTDSNEKIIYYATDSERVYTDYKAKNLSGISELPLYVQRKLSEDIDDDLFNAVGDGWEEHVDINCISVLEWKDTEHGTELGINYDKLHEICNVYVSGKELEVYEHLQRICNELNTLTNCIDGSAMVIYCHENVWKANTDINFKLLA